MTFIIIHLIITPSTFVLCLPKHQSKHNIQSMNLPYCLGFHDNLIIKTPPITLILNYQLCFITPNNVVWSGNIFEGPFLRSAVVPCKVFDGNT